MNITGDAAMIKSSENIMSNILLQNRWRRDKPSFLAMNSGVSKRNIVSEVLSNMSPMVGKR